ncbi:MAG: sigma-70 family RNA polymerase sigma factor [Deltaproteobacteria bacterium]|nr:sigma-70 family RNA polymerase sigma factor [Deltaproteobacteria bacterium]
MDSLLSRLSSTSYSEISLSPFQRRVDGLIQGFSQQITDGNALTSIILGGIAYRLGRIAPLTLGSQTQGLVPSLFLRGGSYLTGLAAEVLTFEGARHGLASVQGNPLTSSFSRDIQSSFINFASLKFFGALGSRQNIITRHLLSDIGMVLGHESAYRAGLAPEQDGNFIERLVEAEVINLQLSFGVSLLHRSLPRLQTLERSLELILSPEIQISSRWVLESLRHSQAFALAHSFPALDSAHEVNPLGSLSVHMSKGDIAASDFDSRSNASSRALRRQLIQSQRLSQNISIEEERELISRAQNGDQDAQSTLINLHLRRIVQMARNYSRWGNLFEDLVQEGRMGLLKGIEKFEVSRGNRLLTYAEHWIDHYMLRYLKNNGKNIRYPVHVQEAMNQLRRTLRENEAQGRSIEIDELAAQMQLPKVVIQDLMELIHAQYEASLDAPLQNSEEKSVTRLDLIADRAPRPDEEVIQLRLRARLEEVFEEFGNSLNPTDKIIFEERLLENETTYKDLSLRIGLSTEKIKFAEKRLSARLKNLLTMRGLAPHP